MLYAEFGWKISNMVSLKKSKSFKGLGYRKFKNMTLTYKNMTLRSVWPPNMIVCKIAAFCSDWLLIFWNLKYRIAVIYRKWWLWYLPSYNICLCVKLGHCALIGCWDMLILVINYIFDLHKVIWRSRSNSRSWMERTWRVDTFSI